MNKLISMTDFVLEFENNFPRQFGEVYSEYNESKSEYLNMQLKSYKKYAKLLKKPLKLGMFVTCDEEGNVLEEPLYTTNHSDECYCNKCENETARCSDLQKKLIQAKQRVLFEGYYVSFNAIHSPCGGYLDESKLKGLKIENLVNSDLTLTENALKQIF